MENGTMIEQAKSFIYRNARLLDRRRYEYEFGNGSREAVIEALRPYQNDDGGFGNALEPDMRCPYSQPVPAEMALAIMDEVECFDARILDGIIGYLRDISLPDGGFPLVFRNVGEYPHAPWWTPERDDRPSMNPTGTIIGLLYKQRTRTDFLEEDWFQKAVSFVWRTMDGEKPEGYHNGIHWIHFLAHTPERDKAAAYWPVVDEWLSGHGTIELDLQADGYVQKVLDWAPSPDSYARKFVSDADVRKHLEALVRLQREDGGWPINWEPLSPGVGLEWRGWVTAARLKTLNAYGMISV